MTHVNQGREKERQTDRQTEKVKNTDMNIKETKEVRYNATEARGNIHKYSSESETKGTRQDTRQSNRGRLGRSSNAKLAIQKRYGGIDGRTDRARCRVACPRLKRITQGDRKMGDF